jgi:hypothetical protein
VARVQIPPLTIRVLIAGWYGGRAYAVLFTHVAQRFAGARLVDAELPKTGSVSG